MTEGWTDIQMDNIKIVYPRAPSPSPSHTHTHAHMHTHTQFAGSGAGISTHHNIYFFVDSALVFNSEQYLSMPGKKFKHDNILTYFPIFSRFLGKIRKHQFVISMNSAKASHGICHEQKLVIQVL